MSDSPWSSRPLKLRDRTIGEGEPCFIIAEAGVNHNGDVDLALKLVDMAADAGADAVKFQKRHLPSLYPAGLLADANTAEWNFQYLLPTLRDTELSDDDFRRIRAYCDEREIRFMCTPWDEHTLDFLEQLDVELYKVASADLINLPLLEALGATGKPLILSTGMATFDEVETTAAFLGERDIPFALLHCISTYPAPFENLNLRTIERLKQFGAPVGYSSHERGIAMPLAAVTLGACIVEKHITVDRTLPGPDHPASIEAGGIQKLVRDIRNLELALGGEEKVLSAMELQNRQVLRKSLVAARDLTAGTVIERAMVRTLGPGKGLSPQRIDDLVGATLHRDIATQQPFVQDDLAPPVALEIDSAGFHHRWGLKARFHDLHEVQALKPELIELHFSEDDVNFPFVAPEQPYEQQLVIHAPEFSQQRLLNLCSADPETRLLARDLIQATIDRAVELGKHFSGGPVAIVVHVGGMSMDEPELDIDAQLQRAADTWRTLNPRGLTLLPENLPPRPWYLGGQWFQNAFTHPDHLVEFCTELGIGCTLDISHAQLWCAESGMPLQEFVDRTLPFSRHLHLADAAGIDNEGLQIGEGVIDWPTLLTQIERADFTWVPEIWSGHLHNHQGFVHALNRLAALGHL
jgi:sialic acid synthase SpsE/sugar phosphate isomerase/epimerase